MEKETYPITEYVHDQTVAFCGAMNAKDMQIIDKSNRAVSN